MFLKLKLAILRIARWFLRPLLRRKKSLMRPTEDSRKALISLVESLPCDRPMVMIEVGSYRGESAQVFLGTNRFSRIYCIDPWKMYYDANDGAAFTDMAFVENDFDQRLGGDDRVIKVKGTIDTFLEKYPDVEIDFAYVDGCHTYDAVKHDLRQIMTCRKPKVAISGHDYYSNWQGLRAAIEESLGKPDAVFSDSSWVKYLQK